MSDRYEDEAPRLAVVATQGRWISTQHGDADARWWSVNLAHAPARQVARVMSSARGAVDSALVAYHHPARVVALAAVVRAARQVLWLHRRDSLETDIAAAEAALDEALRRLDEEA